ncbi:MAG: CoA pyrophosphatase [Ignavibacteriales bacterium]|nr:CoA pyrophosphatase [Ignavibacteriales bacterium]
MINLSAQGIQKFFSTYHRKEISDSALKRAGILLLLFEEQGILHFLLTKRTEDVEHHKGQISFPGGSVDAGDDDIIATALRETEEEIGLKKDLVQVFGLFDDQWVPSGFVITPVVAFLPAMPSLNPNKEEVAEILKIPVSFFLDKKNERVEQRYRNGVLLDVYFYKYDSHEVWGATAAIIRAFLRALR